MINFATFIFTLLLSHITRAMPACGDVASPEELYDLTYADAQAGQHALPAVYNVTWSRWYDDKNGDTKQVACSSLARRNPRFGYLSHFPYIGGAFVIKRGSQNNCDRCWMLTNVKTKKWIIIFPIDSDTNHGFNISKEAYDVLSSGSGNKSMLAEATPCQAEDAEGPNLVY